MREHFSPVGRTNGVGVVHCRCNTHGYVVATHLLEIYLFSSLFGVKFRMWLWSKFSLITVLESVD
jgi:hypothetical protein